jgi:hypothetical protein
VHYLLSSPEAANYRAFYNIEVPTWITAQNAVNEACEEAGLFDE